MALLTREYYDNPNSDFSVTDLLKPPRLVQLMKRHNHRITMDVMNTYHTFFGQMAHAVVENVKDGIKEARYTLEVLGKTVSGKLDWHSEDGRIIRDYKFPSVWSLVFGDLLRSAEKQLNLYAVLLRANGFDPKAGEVIAFPKDWDRNKVYDSNYPRVPFNVYPIELWPPQEAVDFLYERVMLHKNNALLPDEELEECTPEETWERPTTWAVMKGDNKRATRVLSSLAEAETFCNGDDKFVIVERPGKRVRCEEWCDAAPFCSQFKRYVDATVV